jgi:hypothetical protein
MLLTKNYKSYIGIICFHGNSITFIRRVGSRIVRSRSIPLPPTQHLKSPSRGFLNLGTSSSVSEALLGLPMWWDKVREFQNYIEQAKFHYRIEKLDFFQ